MEEKVVVELARQEHPTLVLQGALQEAAYLLPYRGRQLHMAREAVEQMQEHRMQV
jgi:hypothetical protein